MEQTQQLPPLVGIDPRTQRQVTIQVLFHDQRYLVICKPHDLRIDGPIEDGLSVEQILNESFAHPRKISKLYLVHQLDAITSGVHLWALSSKDCGAAGKLFQTRKAHKTYVALVRGHVPLDRDNWLVDQPIGDNLDGARMAAGGRDARAAQSKLTTVLYPVSLIRLEPASGRRHQLRVHCAHSGFPILGDLTYDRVGEIPVLPMEPAPPADMPPPPPNRPLVHWASVCALRTYLHAAELVLPLSDFRGGVMRVAAPEPFSAELRE